jgi:EAL domain-containing protein (putative c-di-GMP-specific phosphodiesterase class I)/GGDEF domain-containing protein
MSLIRQIWWLLAATLLAAFVGSVVVSVDAARRTLETQLRLKNSDNAAALALALSQQKGQLDRIELMIAAQFDTGFYRRIRLAGGDGKLLVDREAPAAPLQAPAWFAALAAIESPPGLAQVSDGWRALGQIEVVSQTAYAYDELWRASEHAALVLALIALVVGAAGTAFVARWRPPLDRAVEQAKAIERGDYREIDEPAIPELRRLTRAMNAMTVRLKRIFEAHATQVDALRRAASEDELTGLSNRGHFMAKLSAALEAEDGAPACGLVLWRVPRLGDVNATLGRPATDKLLQSVADALKTHAAHIGGSFVGRINASDFAVGLPAGGVALKTARAVNDLLRETMPRYAREVAIVAGAIEVRRGAALPAVMGAADLALARAESRGAFAVEAGGSADLPFGALGEGAWRERVQEALVQGRATLGRDALVDVRGRIVHWESPLRLQLEAGGPHLPAAHWLPLALRAHLTADADARALALALAEIERDGEPRGVNLSPASLADSGYAARLRGLLLASPRAAAQVWIEIPEIAAAEQFALVQELGRQLRPAGARFGLEHAGERLGAIERLFEAGLDYVKLDGTVILGVADDAGRARFVQGLVAMLHALALQVFAEGVANEADARALWDCGVDGITGPWVRVSD